SLFFLNSSGYHRELLSFPTRRSSDLGFASPGSSPASRVAPASSHATRECGGLRGFHLAEQPLQAGEMLLIVAAEIVDQAAHGDGDRKSTRLNSSHVKISYAVFCLKKK